MSTTIEQVRLDVVMQCLHLMGDVDAAIDAARRIVNFVADTHDGPSPRVCAATSALSVRARPAPVARSVAADPQAPETQAAETADPAPQVAPAPAAATESEDTPPLDAAPAPVGVGRGAGPKARWDAAAEDVLRAQWGTGKPVEEIAAAIGRTVGSTRERARRLGLSRPKRAQIAPEYRRQPTMRSATQPGRDQPVSGHADGRGAELRTLAARPPQTRATRSQKTGVQKTGTQKSGTQNTGTKGKRRRRPSHEDMRGAQPIDISAYRIQRPGETIDSVVNFVRSRDYQVVQAGEGLFVVDERKRFTESEFVDWANGLRRMLNKPAFALACAQAG